MKKLFLLTTTILLSLVSFSQNVSKEDSLIIDSLEITIFQKVNEYRVSQGFKPLTFSKEAYEVAKKNSNYDYGMGGPNLDTVFGDIGATYISNGTKKYSSVTGEKNTVEYMSSLLIDYWVADVENEVYVIVHFDLGNGDDYSGAVGTILVDGVYNHTLVIHETNK